MAGTGEEVPIEPENGGMPSPNVVRIESADPTTVVRLSSQIVLVYGQSVVMTEGGTMNVTAEFDEWAEDLSPAWIINAIRWYRRSGGRPDNDDDPDRITEL